jgi:hypothetical protein
MGEIKQLGALPKYIHACRRVAQTADRYLELTDPISPGSGNAINHARAQLISAIGRWSELDERMFKADYFNSKTPEAA